MALPLQKIIWLLRSTGRKKLELDRIDENSEVEVKRWETERVCSYNNFSVDLLTSLPFFQNYAETTVMQQQSLGFVFRRTKFNHMSNHVLQGLLSLTTEHHSGTENVLALKPTLQCMPWKMYISKTESKQNVAESISSNAVYIRVWLSKGLWD